MNRPQLEARPRISPSHTPPRTQGARTHGAQRVTKTANPKHPTGPGLTFAAVLLAWTVADQAVCVPHGIALWDAYIGGPGAVNASIGFRVLPPSQASFQLATDKILWPGCALAWQLTAINADGTTAPAECQPRNLTADGIAWEGI